MGEMLMDRSPEETALAGAELSEEEVTNILAEHGFEEVKTDEREEDRKRIVEVGVGLFAAGAALSFFTKSRLKRRGQAN